MAQTNNVRFGQYSSKKDREEYGKELRKAHFCFGTSNVDATTSYKQQFAPYVPQADSKSKESGPGVRATHFILGCDKRETDSTYKQSFGEKKTESVALKKELLTDLRATHYNLGYEKRDFRSTQQQSYAAPQNGNGGENKKAYTRENVRAHSYKFGDAKLTYESSQNAAFNNNRLEQARELNKVPAAGGVSSFGMEEVKKAHFQFGNDKSNFVTSNTLQFNKQDVYILIIN